MIGKRFGLNIKRALPLLVMVVIGIISPCIVDDDGREITVANNSDDYVNVVYGPRLSMGTPSLPQIGTVMSERQWHISHLGEGETEKFSIWALNGPDAETYVHDFVIIDYHTNAVKRIISYSYEELKKRDWTVEIGPN